ncbi:monooxygenase AgnL5 [Penicillium hordei]|uniref:Monooxygenase AgnL5 n=1 Tax=Penicillium hordei TaxID=40994 RepID=A0AAD6DUD5_9EURO|nr:monooxygenase AgnL5 [Penicillium hordei]KAJ5592629.1 monooxygenase AgnL5 [Penicillium hordei]
MPAPEKTQAATLEKFIDAWKRWDAQEWLALFSDGFTQVTLPLGLGIPSRPRAQVAQVLPALMATVKSYELTVRHVVHDAANNKAAIYASSKGTLPWGKWQMDYAAFLTFSEAGDKVDAVEEMLDTARLQEFGPKFGEYLAANGGPVAVATGIKQTV